MRTYIPLDNIHVLILDKEQSGQQGQYEWGQHKRGNNLTKEFKIICAGKHQQFERCSGWAKMGILPRMKLNLFSKFILWMQWNRSLSDFEWMHRPRSNFILYTFSTLINILQYHIMAGQIPATVAWFLPCHCCSPCSQLAIDSDLTGGHYCAKNFLFGNDSSPFGWLGGYSHPP